MTAEDQRGFDQWLAFTFDQPVTDTDWVREFDLPDPRPDATELLIYWTRAFEDCEIVLSRFSDAQVAEGLYYMISADRSDQTMAFLDPSVPLPIYLGCLTSMGTLFENYFAKCCSPHLSQLITGTPPEGLNALNGICYMWWDILPRYGAHLPARAQIEGTIIAVIERCLNLDSIACQESALFGLWSYSHNHPELDDMIDRFIDTHADFFQMFTPGIREAVFGR